jgi:hypothetical protein
MTNSDKAKHAIERLVDEMDRDVSESSEEELLTEAVENYGTVDNMMDRFAEIVGAAEAHGQEQHSASALRVEGSTTGGNVFEWPHERKRKLLDEVSRIFQGELTAAARNGNESDEDLDFMIEKYIKIGVIDSEGKILE